MLRTTLLALLLSSTATFPSSSRISWMTPDAFRLTVGMKRQAALRTLEGAGWKWRKGKVADEVVVHYAEGKTLTLQFRWATLQSIRFELVGFIPEIRESFKDQVTLLEKKKRRRSIARSRSVAIFDDRIPNIMVVTSIDAATEFGKNGLAYLVVRYFEPPAP